MKYVKEFIGCHASLIAVPKKKCATKMKILSLTQHWIKEQRDRSLEHVTSCEFPNHAQCKK